MKKLFTLTLIFFICVQFLAAQQAATENKAEAVQWSEKSHNFGKIVQSKPATAVFTFKNASNAPVVISGVKSSCGCTVASYTKEPVKPGDTGEVKATYNAARVGTFNKSVTVTFAGEENAVILIVRGEVVAKAAE